MITEALVILACTNNQGCSQAESAYLQSHPEIKRFARHEENQIKDMGGTTAVILSPIATAVFKRSANIPITRYLSLQVSDRDSLSGTLKLTISF